MKIFKSYVPKKFSDGKPRFVKDGEVYTYTTNDPAEIKLMEKLGYAGIDVKDTKVIAPVAPIASTPEVVEPVNKTIDPVAPIASTPEVVEPVNQTIDPVAPIASTPEVVEPVDPIVVKQPTVYTDVTTLQQAKLILVDKYGLAKNARADVILAKAAELGVEFPNVKVE